MELITVVDILRDKKGLRKEAHLIFFEFCNMSCSFCHQDHDSRVGMTDIASKVDQLIANSSSTDSYIVNFTGGELFLDEFPDSLFEAFYEAGRRVLDYYDDVILVLGSNLVYSRLDRLKSLVDRLRVHGSVKVATSYDPAGRFSPSQRELFITNLKQMHDYVETVNVVITKQNIDSFLAGKEGIEVDWMCENFDVYFDHYIPSQMYKYLQPDEDLISKLYIHLNKRYPNTYPIKDWKNNLFNETTCRSTKIVNKDNVVTTCWSEAGKDSILDEAEGLKAKGDAEIRFIEKYSCLACEYYSRCGMRCFLHHSFVEDGLDDNCRIKMMYNVILS